MRPITACLLAAALFIAIVTIPSLSAADTCHASVRTIPASCERGSITSDTWNGCRQVTCGDGTNSLRVLACDKPGSSNAQYYEMYKQAQFGTGAKICIGSTCIDANGFARSSDLPYCVEEPAPTCANSVRDVTKSCTGGTITTDSWNGACRTVVCTNGGDSMQVLACDKSGFFEMYKQSKVGTSVSEICLDTTCMNQNNFERSSNFPICTGAAQPDLTVSGVSGPASAATGQAITVHTTISNQGQATPPDYQTTVYLSTDNIITSGDTVLGSFTSPPLFPGASRTTPQSFSLPPNLQGTFFLGAITDTTNVAAESNEGNNAAAGNQIVIGGTPAPGSDLTDGLHAFFDLDGNFNDIPGGHNGVIREPVTFTSGKLDEAAQFTTAGNPKGSAMSSNLYLDNNAQVSVSFWVHFSGGSGTIWQWPARYELVRETDGSIELRSYERYGHTVHTVNTAPIADGEWHHVAIVMNRQYPEKSGWLYLDGEPIGSVKDADENTHGIMWWGGVSEEWYAQIMSQNGFNGAVDEVGVWTRLLSPSEIDQLYNAGASYPFGTSAPEYEVCYAEMQRIPAECSSGTVTSDVLSGDTCRYITCTNGADSTTAKVCNKPGKYNPQYFEMYRQNSTGVIDVCLEGSCVGRNTFARSELYPICR